MLGCRINLYGGVELFRYSIYDYNHQHLYKYCITQGFGPIRIIDQFYGPDDTIYEVRAFTDGAYLNEYHNFNYRCYGDILITRYSPIMDRPMGVDMEVVEQTYLRNNNLRLNYSTVRMHEWCG